MKNFKKLPVLLMSLSLAALVSCGSGGSSSESFASTKTQSMEDRIKGGYEVGKDETGAPRMQSDRRSSFEDARFAGASSSASGKGYSKKGYNRDRWSGGKSYNTKNYGGDTRAEGYDKSPLFVRENAHLAKNSRFSRKDYGTGNYQTNRSREQGSNYKTGANTYTESRRNKRPKDPITTYRQEQEMSVEDTNALLGR